ncbi:MAG: PilZ domain-containing protein [Pseudomonadota bacterium]
MAETGTSAAKTAALYRRDMRRHVRRDIPLEAQFVLPDGNEILGEIENISAGGALIRSDAQVELGDKLIVRIRQIGHFPAVVIRIDDYAIAVEFKIRRERAARIADKLICMVNEGYGNSENRIAPRVPGHFTSKLTFDDGKTIPCEVIDFSTSGAAVSVVPMPSVGSTVQLGKSQARVVRAEDGVVGLSFARPFGSEII